MPLRGAAWFELVGSGVFALTVQCPRFRSVSDVSVRAASFFSLITFGDRLELPLRGGWFIDAVHAGVFAFCLQHGRASSFDYLGVRAALLSFD